MTPLLLLIPFAFWAIAGLLAERKAQHLGIPQRAGARAVLQGGVWAREVLIWSTKQPAPQLADTASQQVDISADGAPINMVNDALPEDIAPSKKEQRQAAAAAKKAAAKAKKEATAAAREEKKAAAKAAKAEKKAGIDPGAESAETSAEEPIIDAQPIPVSTPLETENIAATPTITIDEPSVVVLDPAPQTKKGLFSRGRKKAATVVDLPDDGLLQLNADAELEPFDSLPKKPPRAGTIKTVCPTCRKKTPHDKTGTCKKCHEKNAWLRRRWSILDEGEELEVTQVDVYKDERERAASREAEAKQAAEVETVRAQAPVSVTSEVLCPACHRRLILDYHGRCVFCGNQSGGVG